MDNFLPVHRRVGYTLAGSFLAFSCWAIFGELDITASSQGKLVPASFVKVAQPSESGPVRKVLVADGSSVKAGQPLVELDPVFIESDIAAARSEVDRLTLQLGRIEAELQNKPFNPAAGLDATATTAALAEYTARRNALNASMSEAHAVRDKAAADLNAAMALQHKAQQLAPFADRQAHMLEQLKEKGFVAETALLDKLREKTDTSLEAKAKQAQVTAAAASVKQAEMTIGRILSDYQRQLAQERTDTQGRLAQAQADFNKKAHHSDLLIIKAPVDGVVNGLSVHGPGQVVSAGATLMSIIPANEPLRFEGWLRNEDIAFASPGMPIKVKLAAYPFQKYGWLDGEVTWLGVDSETPEAMKNTNGEPLYFRVRATLKQQSLSQNDLPITLQPGLSAVGDIQLGKRSLLEYLTSPVKKALLEAAHER